MGNNIITIPSLNLERINETHGLLCELFTIAKDYGISLHSSNINLGDIISKYENDIRDIDKKITDRLDTWKSVLDKYYKMTLTTDSSTYTPERVSYIFPYEVNDSNNTLWVLEIMDGNYEGGIKDHSYILDEKFDCDVTLEEISEIEFRQYAVNSVKHVIDRRLEKIEKTERNN